MATLHDVIHLVAEHAADHCLYLQLALTNTSILRTDYAEYHYTRAMLEALIMFEVDRAWEAREAEALEADIRRWHRAIYEPWLRPRRAWRLGERESHIG